MGSLIRIKYILLDQVDVISYNEEGNEATITLVDDAEFSDFEFIQGSGSFTETEKISEGGSFFEQELNFQIPRVEGSKNQTLEVLRNKKLILAIQDGNQNQWILGSKENPVYFKKILNRPGHPSGLNNYQINIIRKSEKMAESIAASGSGGGYTDVF